MQGTTTGKPGRPPAKTALSLTQFIFLITGLVSVVFVAAVFYIVVIFQNVTEATSERDITGHVTDATGVLTRTFGRYLLIGQQLAGGRELTRFIDEPEAVIDAGNSVIAAKVNFDIEEAFLLSPSGEVLFQSARDAPSLEKEEFKRAVGGVFNTKIRRGIFIDSAVHENPVFYLIFPVVGERDAGVLVLGKVFSREYLGVLFPSAQRGVIVFSGDGGWGAVSSNVAPAVLDGILAPAAVREAIGAAPGGDGFSYRSDSKEFNGLLKIQQLRFNTFPVGTVGFYLDTADVSAMRNDFLYAAFATLLINGALQVVVFMLLRKSIISPIAQLEDGFERVTAGDLGVRLETRGLEDMRTINASFNRTVATLQDMYLGLEEKVRQRTEEIEEARGKVETVNKTLNQKLEELERMNKLMVGRELRMVELKEEIERLKGKGEG